MNVTVFGDKKEFAIQLGLGSSLSRSKVCLWANEVQIGDFKKSAEIEDIVSSFEAFLLSKEKYYFSEVTNFSASEIDRFFVEDYFSYLMGVPGISGEEIDRRRRVILYWGRQLDGMNLLFLYDLVNVSIFYMTKTTGPKVEKIGLDVFKNVVVEFLEYCEVNGLQ